VKGSRGSTSGGKKNESGIDTPVAIRLQFVPPQGGPAQAEEP
jgi:hypothetical protein